MTPLELYQLYLNAYVQQSEQDRQYFIRTIKNFTFSKFRFISDQLFTRWQEDPLLPNSKTLRTGGSTRGETCQYEFGPYDAILDMEYLQKGENILWLSGTQIERAHVTRTDRTAFQFRYDGSNLNELFYYIHSFHGMIGKAITLCAQPHNLLYLTAHPRFVDFIITNKHKIQSIVTTDCEPFFKKDMLIKNGIHINDCMIDWQTGLNFSTCPHHRRHIMPLFFLYEDHPINWLNLANKTVYPTLDRCDIKTLRPEKCQCGKVAVNVNIIPRSYVIFPFRRDLPELVRSHFLNLQFIRTNDSIAIFYTTRGPLLDCDRDLFEDLFKDYWIEYVPNRWGLVGTKWPAFWDTVAGPVKSLEIKY